VAELWNRHHNQNLDPRTIKAIGAKAIRKLRANVSSIEQQQ
jgi:hypothetical protein